MKKKRGSKGACGRGNGAQGRKGAWHLYVLECGDGSFYTGITKDIDSRVKKHNEGKGAAYTRTHRPVKLIYQEPCVDRGSALVRELQVKSLSRRKKEELVESQ